MARRSQPEKVKQKYILRRENTFLQRPEDGNKLAKNQETKIIPVIWAQNM